MMKNVSGERSVSMWAALGAPVVGIPLMVALLAVTAPAERPPAAEAEPVTQVERAEAQPADGALEAGAGCAAEPTRRG